jgi:hypothetical protein
LRPMPWSGSRRARTVSEWRTKNVTRAAPRDVWRAPRLPHRGAARVVAVERVVAARNRSLVPATALTPLLILGLGVAVDLWVYFDARRHEAVGKPVILRAGSLTIETPAAWAAGCLILWIVLFPLYVTSRP